MTTRRDNVLTYLNEWRDGSWFLNRKDAVSVPQHVADETVAYAGLADTLGNVGAYTQTVVAMLEDGTLKYVESVDGWLTLEVA